MAKVLLILAAVAILNGLILAIWIGGARRAALKPPEKGVEFLVEFDVTGVNMQEDIRRKLSTAEEAFRRRLKKLGSPAYIESRRENRLSIKVPQLSSNNLSLVRQTLTAQGLLEFRRVHAKNDELMARGVVESGYEVLQVRRTGSKTGGTSLLVSREPEELTTRHIKSLLPSRQKNETYQLNVAFNAEGTRLLKELTTRAMLQRLAIVVDKKIWVAPVVREPISNGSVVIEASFSPPEVFFMASILEQPIETPFRVIEESAF